jgi:cytochrome c553
LNQLMRAVLFVNSNVIFAAQDTDPGAIRPDAQSSMSTNPLTGLYGGWQAIENSSLALAEAAALLVVPGRLCENGKPVPTDSADWARFAEGLRAAGMASYKAAQSKNQDAVIEAADGLVTACANCHDVYRDKSALDGRIPARCVK